MKKLSIAGIALLFCVLFGQVVMADSTTLSETQSPALTDQEFVFDSSLLDQAVHLNCQDASARYTGRGSGQETDQIPMGARSTSYVALDGTRGVDVMAFSNTNALMNAASLLSESGSSLSSVTLGRVPYHQLLLMQTTATNSVVKGAAETPEPASLILIGTGLAALAASLRKRNKKVTV